LAKYPFTPQAAERVQELDHRTTELENQEYTKILQRAEQRIDQAIKTKQVASSFRFDDETELLSFPIAMMMVISSNDKSLKKTYALAEAKRVYALLKQEDRKKLVAIGHLFSWKIRPAELYIKNLGYGTLGLSLDFASYLKNSTIFHESKWKLVNRNMLGGDVLLTVDETARLLAEEVRVNIEKKLDLQMDIGLPLTLVSKIEKLRQLYTELRKIQEEEMPKEVVVESFPPCINRLYNTATAQQHLSHIERFALTSFLLNSGMSIEKIVECFRPTSDFSEKMTRYQVEHIAGGKGSRTKYKPPMCSTLRTHRLCPGSDKTCERIHGPLGYYKAKLRTGSPKTPEKARA
jgi:DNA primase large subunit